MEKVECPGLQEWDTETCSCQCLHPVFGEGLTECSGNQQLNVLCHCACPSTPVCRNPKTFDPSECGCVCRDPQICEEHTIWDSDSCQCASMETAEVPQIVQSARSLGSPSPSRIMTRRPSMVQSSTLSKPSSNPNLSPNANAQCLMVGEWGCDSQGDRCCNADSLGILCIASSDMDRAQRADGGICCIGYHHDGCSTDNDCCFANSFCEMAEGESTGLCRRKMMQLSGHYDPSENVENNAFQSADQEMNLRPAEGMNSKVERVLLSPGVRIWAVVMAVIILSNVLCCARVECKSWTKEQAKRKRFMVRSDRKEDRDRVSMIRMEIDERNHAVQLKSGEFDDSESE